jgi:hypothetical protein
MRTWVLPLAAMLAGCSSGFDDVSARQGCADIWESVCTRYYACYRPDQIAEIGLPPTAAGCTDQLVDQNCGEFTDTACGDGTLYHPAEVYPCTQAILAVDCALVADAPGSVTTCNAVCGN